MDGHASRGAAFAAPNWYFAEGSQNNGWTTYLLLFNPTGRWATVQAEYLTASGSVWGPQETIGPMRRYNITMPGGLGDFGVVVHSLGADPVPIVVERSMYNGWNFGTVTEGATSPSQRLLFSEGSTEGPNYWSPFFLVANPSAVDAYVTLDFRRPDGSLIASPSFTIPAKRRINVWPVSYGVSNQPFSTEVRVTGGSGSVPPGIIAERVILWEYSSVIGAHIVMGMP